MYDVLLNVKIIRKISLKYCVAISDKYWFILGTIVSAWIKQIQQSERIRNKTESNSDQLFLTVCLSNRDIYLTVSKYSRGCNL